MKDKSTIDIHIPVPWSSEPARISARGFRAVLIAAIAAVIIILILAYR